MILALDSHPDRPIKLEPWSAIAKSWRAINAEVLAELERTRIVGQPPSRPTMSGVWICTWPGSCGSNQELIRCDPPHPGGVHRGPDGDRPLSAVLPETIRIIPTAGLSTPLPTSEGCTTNDYKARFSVTVKG